MSSEDPFDHPGEESYDEPRYAITGAIMVTAIIVIVLVLVVWFDFFLHVCATWFWRQPARFPRRRRSRSPPGPLRRRRVHFTRQERPRLRKVGLASAIVGTMPVFVYKSQNFKDHGVVCGVCQYALQENDNALTLPNCKHSFHVDCIHFWFLWHSTCPFCRTSAHPGHQVLKSARVEQVSATISEPITSGSHDILNSEERQSARSPGRQKQMSAEMGEGTSGGRELMALRIEQPRRPDGFSSSVEAQEPCSPNGSQSSSRSPVARHSSPTSPT